MGKPGHRLQGVQPKASAYRFEFEAMSSVCEICLDDAQGAGEPALAGAAAQAISEVRRIEVAYSRYRADSIVSRINAAAGGPDSVLVDDETASLLSFAAQLHASATGCSTSPPACCAVPGTSRPSEFRPTRHCISCCH